MTVSQVQRVSPTLKKNANSEILTVAAGCFWGVEHMYRKHYGNKGIVDMKVGYANGNTQYLNPSYETVKSGVTEYYEVLQVSFDPEQVSYEELLQFFFRIHDASQADGQAHNIGSQYKSGIFTYNEKQHQEALEALEVAQKDWYPHHKIATVVKPLESFWDAEDYHQQYLVKNKDHVCPAHYLRVKPKAA